MNIRWNILHLALEVTHGSGRHGIDRWSIGHSGVMACHAALRALRWRIRCGCELRDQLVDASVDGNLGPCPISTIGAAVQRKVLAVQPASRAEQISKRLYVDMCVDV